ncbi:MAG TPA: dCMP deaminase [Lactobacillus sp.]|nr:dCMP deaminase [Lactobacillus sp.]
MNFFPCLNCTKALIQAGIKRIVYAHDYRNDPYGEALLKQHHLDVLHLAPQD